MTQGVARTLATFEHALAATDEASRANAIRVLASMVGALVLARAATDESMRCQVLTVIRESEPIRTLLGALTPL